MNADVSVDRLTEREREKKKTLCRVDKYAGRAGKQRQEAQTKELGEIKTSLITPVKVAEGGIRVPTRRV